MITLAGTVIHKSGNMTGGSGGAADTRPAKLRAASEKSASRAQISEKEFAKLQARKEELTKQVVEIEAEEAAAFRQQEEEAQLTQKILSLENRLKYAELDLNTVNKKINDNEKKLKVADTHTHTHTHTHTYTRMLSRRLWIDCATSSETVSSSTLACRLKRSTFLPAFCF